MADHEDEYPDPPGELYSVFSEASRDPIKSWVIREGVRHEIKIVMQSEWDDMVTKLEECKEQIANLQHHLNQHASGALHGN